MNKNKGKQNVEAKTLPVERVMSLPLLKFSGGSGDDYATIPDDSSSPN